MTYLIQNCNMSEENYYEEMYDDSVDQDTTSLVDDDEISPEEEGFMKGYEEAQEYGDEVEEEL